MRLPLLIAIAGMALSLPRPALAVRLDLTPSQIDRLDRGEVLTRLEDSDEDVRMVTCIGHVARPARDVYLLMTDFRNYPRIYDAIDSADVDQPGGNTLVARFSVRVPWPLTQRTVTTETVLRPGRLTFSWRRVSGNIRVYEGELMALPAGDDACTVFFSARIDPGYEWLPSWAINWGQSYVLPSIVQGIRDTLGRRWGPYWAPGVARPAFSREPR